MKIRSVVVLFFFVSATAVKAQNKRSSNLPTSVNPNRTSKVYSPNSSKKKKSFEPTYDAREKFYRRLEGVAKNRRRNEKEGEKPQYSNFQYFGHKKPPKKRPSEKMKFCKICGIRH